MAGPVLNRWGHADWIGVDRLTAYLVVLPPNGGAVIEYRATVSTLSLTDVADGGRSEPVDGAGVWR